MESMSEDGAGDVSATQAYVLRAAAELRFVRPDLTAALASHLSDVAVAAADRDGWLAAAGWRVHAAAAVGDGRVTAADVLDGLSHWGADALFTAAADRLRLELAAVAHGAGDSMASIRLLAVPMTDPGPELAADAALIVARCGAAGAVDDAPFDNAAVGATAFDEAAFDKAAFDEAAFDEAVAAWSRVGEHRGEVGAACTVLVAAALARRSGRARKAVDLAVDGLTRLDHGRIGGEFAPSSHLAAALAAEWVSALIDAGRLDEARDGSVPLRVRLLERARPTRQLALLRLTIARAAASDSHNSDGDSIEQLERAAQDAAAADVPDLEHACRTALGELYESQGRLDAALEAIRLAVAADRRHGARAVRLRAALAIVSTVEPPRADRVVSDSPPAQQMTEGPDPSLNDASGEGSSVWNGTGTEDRTTILQILRPVGAEVFPQVASEEEAADAVRRTAARVAVSEVAAGPVPTTGRSCLRHAVPAERQVPTRRVRTASPWVTGSWSTVETGSARRYQSDDGQRSHSGPSLLKPPVERLATHVDEPLATPSLAVPSLEDRPAEPAPDAWLAGALAELDRIWGTADSAADTVGPPVPDPVARECVVVLDLARAGKRLPVAAGGPTLQRVARRLVGRLPTEARLRDDAPDTLSVVLPSADRATASEWMHRVLPGLAEGLEVDEAAASGALLRAAVHDADGVVGAQIMQRLDSPERAMGDHESGSGEPGADASSVDGGRDRHSPNVPTRPSGKHDQSAGRPAFLPEGVIVRPGSGGRRHRRGSQPAPDEVDALKSTSESTEGLGLADLLAGALAAYRGI